MSRTGSESVPLDALEVRAFRVPTDTPIETDGTFAWSATTMVLVQAAGGGARGIGYTYTDASAATLVRDTLADVIRGTNVFDVVASVLPLLFECSRCCLVCGRTEVSRSCGWTRTIVPQRGC